MLVFTLVNNEKLKCLSVYQIDFILKTEWSIVTKMNKLSHMYQHE